MLDRRKDPREFFVSGWDPYILSLVSSGKSWEGPIEATARNRKLGPTRWRTMLLRRLRAPSTK